MSQHYLNPLIKPQSIAVFGASDRAGSVGAVVFENLRTGGFKGALYPINPKRDDVQGVKALKSLDEVSGSLDLAVIVTPAETVPEIIEACGRRGVKAAVILSAGFGEIGEAGLVLEQKTRETARKYGLRFIGPNCLGLMRPSIGLNATFNKGSAKPGHLALVSQSGALCTAILDWAQVSGVGFSNVVSVGTSADVDFGSILDFLVNDPETESILLYIEGIRQPRSFMSALRAAARTKPVIVIKVGRHAAGSRAARSHTGALVGADDVFDAALRRAGVVRVQSVVQLFALTQALSSNYQPNGNRLVILTNGGGPGAMAADHTADLGVPLAELDAATITALDQVLPSVWSHGNPVDIIGDATPERYAQAIDICMRDPNVDGMLVILTPQAMTAPTEVAEQVIALAKQSQKPLITCWMGEAQVAEARRKFIEAHIPSYRSPEPAVETFAYLSSYYQNQKLLMQAPQPLAHQTEPDLEGAKMIIDGALAEQRTVLSEMESKALLSAFHIPVARTMIARSPNEALLIAEQIGFPVAMKINSPDITHKSDVGGVRLGLANAQAVRSAYHDTIATVSKMRPEAHIDGVSIEPMLRKPNGRELMVGVVADRTFGPVISFGAGGTTVEVLQDRAVALPPLNSFLARDMIASTRVSKLLGSFRHMPPVNMEALEAVLLRVSEMVCELPWVREMDINPLIVDEHGAVAVDARIMLGPVAVSADRYAHMAICPYPTHLVAQWQLNDGTEITLRPIRPEDAQIEQAFVRELSDDSRYTRFLNMQRELSPVMLAKFTQIDYDREMALIATVLEEGQEKQVGVVRYAINPDGKSCEFAMVVADAWQKHGIGHKLLGRLIEVARDKGLVTMEGEVLAKNTNMLQLIESMGFENHAHPEDSALRWIVKRLIG
jgi:acetyltransferase